MQQWGYTGGLGALLVQKTLQRRSGCPPPPPACPSRLIWSGMGAGTHGNSPPGGIYGLCGLGQVGAQRKATPFCSLLGSTHPRTGCSTDEPPGDLAGTWGARAPVWEGYSNLQPLQPAGDVQEQTVVTEVAAPLSPGPCAAHPGSSPFFLFFFQTWECS